MPSRKISLKKNVNKKRKTIISTWFTILSVSARRLEKQNFFRKSNLNMKFKYLEKLQFFRYLKLKSAAILNDVK